MDQIQLASGSLGWWDEFKDKLSGTALGAALLIGAGGIAYLSTTTFPKEYKTYGYIGAGVLGVAGAYAIYKTYKEPTEEEKKPKPGETFPISITDPYPGEEWSRTLPHNVNIEVHNPYLSNRKVFVGMTMIHDKTGEIFDFPIKILDISANSIKKTSWYMYGSPQGSGLYWIISSVWDIKPSGDCEIQGTCHRLGTAESNVIFKWIG